MTEPAKTPRLRLPSAARLHQSREFQRVYDKFPTSSLADGSFSRLLDFTAVTDQWPPPLANAEQLPRVVMLKARLEQSGPLLVYTAILGDRRTPIALEQTLGGIGAKP